MPYYFLRPDGSYSDYFPTQESQPEDREGGVWTEGSPDGLALYVEKSAIEKLSDLITAGQMQMSGGNALPLDIQDQIYTLEAVLQNHFKRGAIDVIIQKIQSFTIAEDREDVTAEQRALVAGLKVQMLAMFG